jgi:glycosyltransferase involved in cell wall biosynthesis
MTDVTPRHPTLVLVPVRDEAATILAVLEGLRAHPVDLLVVDDGSTDEGPGLAREWGAEVLALSPNRGKGLALREGFAVAAARGYRWVVTIDGDGEHDPADLPRFLAALQAGGQVVVGQRQVFRSRGRRALNSFATWWYRQLDPRIHDTTCGFRGFGTQVALALSPPLAGFEFEQVALLEAIRQGFRLEFVPVRIHSAPRTGVGARDLLRANNAFDRWVLDNAHRLPLSGPRRRFLRAAARVGLALGGLLERLT